MTDSDNTKACSECHVALKSHRTHRTKSGELRSQRFCSTSCFYKSLRSLQFNPDLGTKPCSRCKIAKRLSEFDRHRYARDGYKSECKLCRKAYNRKAYHAVKDTPKQKRQNLHNHLGRYGMTIAQFDALVLKQNGVCAICQKPPTQTGRGKRLHVDHCHESNIVRGLLCIHCNRALGSLGDNLAGVMRAVRYLEGQPLDLFPEIKS